MIKVIEDPSKVDMVSDFVTGVIEKNKDFKSFNGGYISCCQDFGLTITLKLITSGFYKPVYSEEELDELCKKTGYYVKVEGMLFSDYANEFASNSFHYPERGMLKSGHIVYDQDGGLTKLQNQYKADRKIDDLYWRGVVDIEPPVQYKKK